MKKTIVVSLIAFLTIVGIANAFSYVVQPNDTLTKIANENNTTVNQLVVDNAIQNPNLIFAGQELNIQSGGNLGGGGLPITDYSTTIVSSMTTATTSISVASLQTKDGHTITTADISPAIYLILEAGSPKQEIVKCSAVYNGTTKLFKECTRGLSFYGTTETAVTANQKSHSAGISVANSNVHYYYLSTYNANTWSATQTFNNEIILATTTPAYFQNQGGVLYYCNNGTSCAAIGAGANTYNFVTPLTTSGSDIKLATSTAWFNLVDNKLSVATTTGSNFSLAWNDKWLATSTIPNLTMGNATTTGNFVVGNLSSAPTNTATIIGNTYIQGNATTTKSLFVGSDLSFNTLTSSTTDMGYLEATSTMGTFTENTTITLGYRPKNIVITYRIQGHNLQGNNTYDIQCGVMKFNGSGSSVGSFTYGTAAGTEDSANCSTFNFGITNATTVTAGSDADDNYAAQITLSVPTISDTGFVIRRVNDVYNGNNGNNAGIESTIMWEAYR